MTPFPDHIAGKRTSPPLRQPDCNDHLPAQRQRVVMLVNNPCINDSRVIKEAEALAISGKYVAVVCRWGEGMPRYEKIRGVAYYRVNPVPKTPKNLARLILSAAHLSKPIGPRGSNTPGELGLQGSSAGRASSISGTVLFGSRALQDCLNAIKTVTPRFADTAETQNKIGEPFGERSTPRGPEEIYTTAMPSSQGTPSRLHPAVAFTARITRRLIRYLWKQLIHRPLLRAYWLAEFEDFGIAAGHMAVSLNPDIVHAHDLATLPTGSRIASKCRAQLIYDSHELEMHRNAIFPWYVWKRRGALERRFIRKANAVITVSDSIADHLAAFYEIRRPEVIMNSPIFSRENERNRSIASLRQRLDLQNQALAVYVGSVTINRGIEQCVRAMRLIPDLRLALIGPRRAITEQEILRLAIELGVRERLFFVDPVPPEKVVSFITGADVSLIPIQDVCLSYRYCLPNKLFESAFAGVPVAASDLPELRRFVESYNCGLLMDQSDPTDIAAKIEAILENPARFKMSPSKREAMLGAYGWPAQARKLCDLYDELSQPPDKASR